MIKRFKSYLVEESKELWKATIFVKNKDGTVVQVPVESSINIRHEVHKVVQKLSKDGYSLEKVQYEE
jgi:hypothetical protein